MNGKLHNDSFFEKFNTINSWVSSQQYFILESRVGPFKRKKTGRNSKMFRDTFALKKHQEL